MKSKGLLLLVIFVFLANGCAVIFQKGKRSDIDKIKHLENELQELEEARKILAQHLSKEMEDKKVRLELADKGLVITFVAEVLFNSGKAKLKEDSLVILDKVVKILKEEVPGNDIGIEGHTDNEPIKFSPWKSNWELSAQRALSVLYYLEKMGIRSNRLRASGYGEYQPVASNNTPEGKQTNRRVEIVILPKSIIKKVADDSKLPKEEELK